MEGPGKLHTQPRSRWENPSLHNAISLPLVLGGSLLVPAAQPGGVMQHRLLPPLLTALRGAPRLCQHFPLPGTCLNVPPASVLTASPRTVVPFDFAHPSQQCLMWTQPICLRILPTSLVKSWCSAACPACPLLADALLCPPISMHWREMSSFQSVSFSTPPLPCPGFTIPSSGTKFHHPTVGLLVFVFFFPGSGDEKADESALLWIHVHSLFPQWSPRTASVHLLLQCPAASQPAPAPHALQPGPRPCFHSPKETENIQKKGKATERKPSAHTATDTLLELLGLIFLW